jgi:putative membrane protein
MNIADLPSINASLNGITTICLCIGIAFIKAGRPKAHIWAMSLALLFSSAFLACYLYYHYHVGHVRFGGQGVIRPIYFGMLISHVFLAIVNLPMIILTVIPALRQRYDKHRRMAKWTFPIWLYVSVTGVLIYFMCYHWFGPPMS